MPVSDITIRRSPGGPLDQLIRELTFPGEELVVLSVGPETGRLRLLPTEECRRRAFSAEPGFPFLFMYPPPWHPFDLLLTNRGIGGRLPEKRESMFRSPPDYAGRVAHVMNWSPSSALVLYHLCTSLHTNYHPAEATARTLRVRLYDALGLHATAARYSVIAAEREPGFMPRFWGEAVTGRVEL